MYWRECPVDMLLLWGNEFSRKTALLTKVYMHEAWDIFEGKHLIHTTHPVFDCADVSLDGGYTFSLSAAI